MAIVRSKYWALTFRQLVKRVLRQCYKCKKFHVKSYPVPQKELLPADRTNLGLPFKSIGTDYAGPFSCKSNKKKERKVYLLLFTCSLSFTTQEFIHALKRLIARRGRPKVIYSDNAKTFVVASKWIEKINKDELMQEYLIKEEIQWKFNLSRAPWWGGQFEQMVGLVKQCLYKITGRANLSQKEFGEIVLDIEVTLNNRPLMYVEEDIQRPVLTPSTLLYGQPPLLPEEDLDEDVPEMKRRQVYQQMQRCRIDKMDEGIS